MNSLVISWMMIERVTLSMITLIDLDGLWMNPLIVKILFPQRVLSMVPINTILCFNDVIFISPHCFDSLCLSLLTTYMFCMTGLEDMVNEKWLDEKEAFRDSFQGLS